MTIPGSVGIALLSFASSCLFHAVLFLGIGFCFYGRLDGLDEQPDLSVSSVSLTLDAAAPEAPASVSAPPVSAPQDPPPPLPSPVIHETTVRPLSKAVALPIASDLHPAPISFPEETEGEETRVAVAKPPAEENTVEPPPAKKPTQTPQPTAIELPPSAESVPSGGSAGRIDSPPTPRRKIKPQYPAISRQRGEEGDVALRLRIDEKGMVVDVRIVQSSGFPELDAAAERACRHAQFTPGKRDGKPVESSCNITLRFKLD